MKQEILNDVIEIICDNCYLFNNEINDDSLLTEDLGLDHLDVVELTMKVEEKYLINITDNEVVESWKKVSDVVETIIKITNKST